MSSETQGPEDGSPQPRSAPTQTQVTSPPGTINPATGCMAQGLGVMFFLGAARMVWLVVSALIHSEWREGVQELGMMALFLVAARIFWLAGRGHNVDIFTGENLDLPVAESEAMLQVLERYDRSLAETQAVNRTKTGEKPEAKIAAHMKERGDPG